MYITLVTACIQTLKCLEPPKQSDQGGRGGWHLKQTLPVRKSKRSTQFEFIVIFLAKCLLKHCREFYRPRGDIEEIQTNQWIPAVRDKQFQILHTTRITLQPDSLPRWRLGRLLSDYLQLQCFMETHGIQYALMRKNSVYIGSSSSSRKYWGKY